MGILSEHRVATVAQLQRLLDLPERTIRYRLARLWELGIAGAQEPYVPRGTAGHHWYPSRRADTLARGTGISRSGEREDPNELFLRHAAGITEFYVCLREACARWDISLTSFLREVEGREEFTDAERLTAIVPDASIVLKDNDAEYRALVEIDFGTMSRPRIARKLGGYAAYVRAKAWTGAHPYLPPLLFLTTSARRVEMICSAVEERFTREAARSARAGYDDPFGSFVVGACAAVGDAHVGLCEAVWSGRDGQDGLRFLDLLRGPWATYHEQVAAESAAAAAGRARRQLLAQDPEEMRTALHDAREHFNANLRELAPDARTALEILYDSTDAMDASERRAFSFFSRRAHFDHHNIPRATYATIVPDDAERAAIAALGAIYLTDQRRQVARWAARYPDLPCVRRAIGTLEGGHLLSAWTCQEFATSVRTDLSRRKKMHGRSLDYLARRTQEIARQRKARSGLGRFRFDVGTRTRAFDEANLGYCASCARLAIAQTSRGYARLTCEFCSAVGDGIISLREAIARGALTPDGKGFFRECHPPMPQWVTAPDAFVTPAVKEESE